VRDSRVIFGILYGGYHYDYKTVNHWVTGSSPVGGAIYIKALAIYPAKAFLLG